jgi:membrane peptidoglycan carboxypeptidase
MADEFGWMLVEQNQAGHRGRRVTIGRLVRMSFLAALFGVVVAMMAFPAAAMTGLAAKAASDTWQKLDSDLQDVWLGAPSRVIAAGSGREIGRYFNVTHQAVTIRDVPAHLQKAIVDSQDRSFYRHNGMDFRSVVRAFVVNNTEESRVDEPSTITMQFVRLAQVQSATTASEIFHAANATGGRQIREIRVALAIELSLTKDAILERYLNLAYFGNGISGVQAASLYYFGKQAQHLTLGEAAVLAGALDAGMEGIHDDRWPVGLSRSNDILAAMVRAGSISAADAEVARRQAHPGVRRFPDNGCRTAAAEWRPYCEHFRTWWRANPLFGFGPADREKGLGEGAFSMVVAPGPSPGAVIVSINRVGEQLLMRVRCTQTAGCAGL